MQDVCMRVCNILHMAVCKDVHCSCTPPVAALLIFISNIRHVLCSDTYKKQDKLDPVGSTVRYEVMKLCAGSV